METVSVGKDYTSTVNNKLKLKQQTIDIFTTKDHNVVKEQIPNLTKTGIYV